MSNATNDAPAPSATTTAVLIVLGAAVPVLLSAAVAVACLVGAL